MSTQAQPAGEAEVLVFLEKLAKLHETLTPQEQAMMDELTVTALSAPAPEVQGFGGVISSVPTLATTFSSPTLLAQPYYYYRQVSSLLGTVR